MTRNSAKVVVVLELTNLGSWGPECQLEQVYKQASEAAYNRINRALVSGAIPDARIIGRPVASAVIVTEDQL